MQTTIPAQDVTALIRQAAEAAAAIIRGDIRRYLTLIKHADDFTLMPPYGGGPERGFDASDERIAAMERFFQSGEVEMGVAAAHVSGDLAVLIVIERQHAEVGGLPDQDWSLWVTLIFRREGGEWRLLHRHADPLVRRRPLEQVAPFARA